VALGVLTPQLVLRWGVVGASWVWLLANLVYFVVVVPRIFMLNFDSFGFRRYLFGAVKVVAGAVLVALIVDTAAGSVQYSRLSLLGLLGGTYLSLFVTCVVCSEFFGLFPLRDGL
jgi:hypothetical protein